MPELKLYTVAQLREWLICNHAAEGLSERIIAPTRAWAIIHNPYVKDDDPVLAAIFVGEEIAAYITAFPEWMDGQRIWWFSTLWCEPKHRGKGYGLIVTGSLVEIYGIDYCYDRWGAPDTIEIFSYFGHKTIYTPRYIMGSKINRNTTKGKWVHMLRSAQKWSHRLIEPRFVEECYSLRYVSYIDDDTYTFICNHRNADYFLHSHEMLNWELRYPFTISAPLVEHARCSCLFSPSEIPYSQLYAVQVIENNQMIGFYILKHNEESMHVLFLYYEEVMKNKVFASIRDHIKQLHIAQCITDNGDLAAYLRSQIYFPKINRIDVSLSFPPAIEMPKGPVMQNGDGDNFIVV